MTVTVILYIYFEVSIVFLDKYFNIEDHDRHQFKMLQVDHVTKFRTEKRLQISLQLYTEREDKITLIKSTILFYSEHVIAKIINCKNEIVKCNCNCKKDNVLRLVMTSF